MLPKIRSIREEAEYTADLKRLLRNPAPHPALLGELINGVCFVIARDPLRGSPVPDSTFRVIAQPLPPLGKILRIYYEFDDDMVMLRAASVM